MSELFKVLGVVGMKFIGTYDAQTTYKKLQVVRDATYGDCYGSKQDDNKGHSLFDTNWWFRITNTQTAQENANIAAVKIDDMTVSSTTGAAGSNVSVEISETGGHKNIAFKIPRGNTGATPNLNIGTVATGEPGSSASVNITGTAESPVMNMSIPRGDPGEESVLVGTQISGNKYQLGIERV